MNEADGERPPLRVLLAIGNAERERQLRDALPDHGISVAGRCLDGPSLVEHAAGIDIDVALASSDLHRLSSATMAAIRETRLPLVLLAEPVDLERYSGLAHLIPASSAAREVADALREAVRRGPVYAAARATNGHADAPQGSRGSAGDEGRGSAGQVITVVSGKGAPGKTTLAIGLAAALAARDRRVVLLDADLRGGNVAAYLDLDPRQGVVGLAFGRNGASPEARVEEELQDGPGFAVLAGVERAEMHPPFSLEVMVSALGVLRSRFDHVIVDAGEVIASVASGGAMGLLQAADRVLLVSGADLVALWNARGAMRYLQDGVGVGAEKVGVVLNRREGREHYAAAEVARALAAPVLASVPQDRRAARRAIAEQSPIGAVGGRAARTLRALAAHLLADGVPRDVAAPERRSPFGRRRSLARRG